MKQIIKSAVYILFICAVSFASCKKEINETSLLPNKKWPVANAGPDQVITLPTDSVILDGSSSSDPDGKITSFIWKKISGPDTLNIINPLSSRTTVKNLVKGRYRIELKVTDDDGKYQMDTMDISVNSLTPSPTNQSPLANAGPDQTITLPVNSANLNGNGSSDPDGSINGYSWTKISGPNQATINNPNLASAIVTNLTEGEYNFRLQISDNLGATDDDTVIVNVISITPPIINLELIPFGTLSQPRRDLVTATAGNKILFAGGLYTSGDDYGPLLISGRVDIYDIVNQTWSTAELSQPRIGMTVATVGNKIFFAGGATTGGGFDGFYNYSKKIDIYDAAANSWSTAELPEASYELSASAIGNKIYFGGGYIDYYGITNKVVIFDISTNSSTAANLSEARYDLSANAIGNKIFFAGGKTNFSGGISKTIDIYDEGSNSWSTDTLNESKSNLASIAVGNKIFWAGGYTFPYQSTSDKVQIYDINTHTSSYEKLFQARSDFSAVRKDNKILFFTSISRNNAYAQEYVDIYDVANNEWFIAPIDKSFMGSPIISAGNKVYVTKWDKVWLCQF